MNRSSVKWLLALVTAMVIHYLAPADLNPKLPMYLGLTAFAVVLWATELIPPVATGAALTFAYALILGIDTSLVFAPWGESLIWISFGELIFGEAMKNTGLARRISLKCLQAAKGNFTALMGGFIAAGLIMAAILPSVVARTVIFCTIGIGIVDSLKFKPTSRFSSIIILMCFYAACAPIYLFLHTSESFIWAFEMMFGKGQQTVGFWEYALHGTFISVVYMFVSFGTVYLVKGAEKLPEAHELRRVVDEAVAQLPPMSSSEWRLLVLIFIGIGSFMVQAWTGYNAVFVFALSGILCYIPEFRIEKPENFDKLNLSVLVIITACISIGMVGNAVRSNSWMVSVVQPLFHEISPIAGVLLSYVIGVVTNFILTPLAATAAFAPAFGELGTQLGINQLPMWYAFQYGLDQYVLPYEMVLFLYIFTTGYVRLGHIVKALALRILLCGVMLLAVAVPYWKLIGIL